MKHVELFNKFLKDVVNINETRLTQLENSTEAIKHTIGNSGWKPKIKKWMAQGSWAHKTIIKPVDAGEFDADLLVFIDPVDGWNAATYLDDLYKVFSDHGVYKDKARCWSHCVTITYANECRIDVAPCLVNRLGTRNEVCNRISNQFEMTDPENYTNWLIETNGYTKGNNFRKVTRLVKYLRDIKSRFTCSSVLLTTLLANNVNMTDMGSEGFGDTPTALKTIIGRLDDWLQANVAKPHVANPFLPSENFSERWTDDQYENFRARLHGYREWVDEAFDENNPSESIAKWRRVFGEDFGSAEAAEEGASVGRTVVALAKRAIGAAQFAGDVVDAIKRFGSSVLPVNFTKKPYMEAPRWKRATNLELTVFVRAELFTTKLDTPPLQSVHSLEPLQAGFWLRFTASAKNGARFNSVEFLVMWRITNTGEVAARENALRGRFEVKARICWKLGAGMTLPAA